MPSLSSFFPTVNPAKPRSTRSAVMPLVPGGGIERGEHDEHVGFVAVGDPELAAVQDEPVRRQRRREWRARTHRCQTRPPTAHTRRPRATRAAAGSAVSRRRCPSASAHSPPVCSGRRPGPPPTDRPGRAPRPRALRGRTCRRRRRSASGTSTPITPRSNSLSISVRGNVACSSISRTSGAISARANSSTLSRNSSSSSSRMVRARLGGAVAGLVTVASTVLRGASALRGEEAARAEPSSK